MLEKIFALIKSAIIDWRIGIVALVGFITALIVTKDITLTIGIAISLTIVFVDIFARHYPSWHEAHLRKKVQKLVSDPKYQQDFFEKCSEDERKILSKLYRAYPNGCQLPCENVAINHLLAKFAIRRANNIGIPTLVGPDDDLTYAFLYTLQPWAKSYLDSHKRQLKKNI